VPEVYICVLEDTPPMQEAGIGYWVVMGMSTLIKQKHDVHMHSYAGKKPHPESEMRPVPAVITGFPNFTYNLPGVSLGAANGK